MGLDVDPSALLQAMAEGLYVVDRKRVISHWNAAAEGITGYTAEQALGRFCGDGMLNHVDEDGEPLCGGRCPLLLTMSDGVEREARVYGHHASGHLVPMLVRARALRDETGAITGAVETFTDDSRAAETEKRLSVAERLAVTDHLTGLGNRRYLERILTESLHAGDGANVAVLTLDIDRFKTVNDNHGHAFGDEVIGIIARTLVNVVGDGGEVGRLGGDEFVVVANRGNSGDIERLAARVRATVAQTRVADAGVTLRITVSVGAVLSIAGDTTETLLKRADDSMFEAKRRGRDNVVGPAGGGAARAPVVGSSVAREH